VLVLYRNGRVHAPASPAATALLVDGGAISWIGDEAGAADVSAEHTVDLAGAHVAPAFVDAHVHATSTGLALTGLDLRGASSLADALARVEAAARAERGRPVLGGGWDDTGWPEHRPPSAAEVDRASYGGVVYLARVDVHSAVASSALMAATPGVQQLRGYTAAGWLRGPAHDAARTAAFAAITARQRREAQRAALRRAAECGIACVHEMAGPVISSADDLSGLQELSRDEPLPEVIGYWAELFGVEAALDLRAVGAGGDLFCDGSLGSHTAALHEPYHDRPDVRGQLRFSTAEVAEHVARCDAAGLQSGFHAIGDAAVDQVLDAIDIVSEQLGRPAGIGHRLEHAEYVRDPARLAASGLVASMQPCFDALWGGESGMYAQRLGAERARQLNRFADLAGAGVGLAFGSDAPVTELGPWAAVRAAAYPHDPTAGISVPAAFDAHTRGAWAAAGRRGEGELAPAAPATFAIWRPAGVDLFDVSPGTPLPTCLATILRGQPIHGADMVG
jgi:predicted amidohydrolase YtcJ